MHWTDLIHSLAGLLIVASASSRTMVPLRILAIATNCFLIIYFSVLHSWLPMLLQAAALPLKAWRLYQMLIPPLANNRSPLPRFAITIIRSS